MLVRTDASRPPHDPALKGVIPILLCLLRLVEQEISGGAANCWEAETDLYKLALWVAKVGACGCKR
jgi:hypothetical protein